MSVDGQKLGRQSEDSLVVYLNLDLAAMDIAIGYKVYRNALKLGLGVPLTVWDSAKVAVISFIRRRLRPERAAATVRKRYIILFKPSPTTVAKKGSCCRGLL